MVKKKKWKDSITNTPASDRSETRQGEIRKVYKHKGEKGVTGISTTRGLYAAATGFRRLLLRDLGFDGARSAIGTLCQPVTSGIDDGGVPGCCCCPSHDVRRL